ncbi:hypothetical protein QF037_001495 [Streptomyces canus]|nr:hypothetical protein [Streptomyces canus]
MGTWPGAAVMVTHGRARPRAHRPLHGVVFAPMCDDGGPQPGYGSVKPSEAAASAGVGCAHRSAIAWPEERDRSSARSR